MVLAGRVRATCATSSTPRERARVHHRRRRDADRGRAGRAADARDPHVHLLPEARWSLSAGTSSCCSRRCSACSRRRCISRRSSARPSATRRRLTNEPRGRAAPAGAQSAITPRTCISRRWRRSGRSRGQSNRNLFRFRAGAAAAAARAARPAAASVAPPQPDGSTAAAAAAADCAEADRHRRSQGSGREIAVLSDAFGAVDRRARRRNDRGPVQDLQGDPSRSRWRISTAAAGRRSEADSERRAAADMADRSIVMRRVRGCRIVVRGLAAPGRRLCRGAGAFKRGDTAMKAGNLDQAVALLPHGGPGRSRQRRLPDCAAARDAGRVARRTSTARAKSRRRGSSRRRAREYTRASEYDPTQPVGRRQGARLDRMIRQRVEASRPRPFQEMQARARAASPRPILNPASREPITLRDDSADPRHPHASGRRPASTCSTIATPRAGADAPDVGRSAGADARAGAEPSDERQPAVVQGHLGRARFSSSRTSPTSTLQYDDQVIQTFSDSHADPAQLVGVIMAIVRSRALACSRSSRPTRRTTRSSPRRRCRSWRSSRRSSSRTTSRRPK